MDKRWIHPELAEFLSIVGACYFALWLDNSSADFNFHRLGVAIGSALLIVAYKQKKC